jgi:hypothetical protein
MMFSLVCLDRIRGLGIHRICSLWWWGEYLGWEKWTIGLVLGQQGSSGLDRIERQLALGIDRMYLSG